jgi:hypothetical protein
MRKDFFKQWLLITILFLVMMIVGGVIISVMLILGEALLGLVIEYTDYAIVTFLSTLFLLFTARLAYNNTNKIAR